MTTAFMTLAGALTEPEAICDQLLMAAFASDYSQSNAFLGEVASFQHLVHANGQNWVGLKTDLTNMFTKLFTRYFAVAEVIVDITQMNNETTKMKITLSARLINEQGTRYDLASLVVAADGIATEILVGDRTVWKM